MKPVEEIAREILAIDDEWNSEAIAEVAAVLRRERKEQREEDCKAVCEMCRAGYELVPVDAVLSSNGRNYWHRTYVDSALRTECRASAIRARGED